MNKPRHSFRHAVSRAKARLNRLKARNARPRQIRRQEERLEARKAVADRRYEEFLKARQVVESLVDEHFPQGE